MGLSYAQHALNFVTLARAVHRTVPRVRQILGQPTQPPIVT